MINTHRHLATAAPLVSMHPRGNTDGGEPVAQGMDSHGGPWEPEMLPRGNADQFTESDKLDAAIKKNLAGLGYEC